jgi:PTH1 family peptidyl-tRNA hydrolase
MASNRGPQGPVSKGNNDRWLVAGLGNPGPQYEGNRHNAGFMVADVLAARLGSGFRRDRSRTQAASGRLLSTGQAGTSGGLPVIVAKPMSFMNLAGQPLAALGGFYKIPPDRTIVVHDDLDLPFGTIRLKLGGGDGGHNGLRSVTRAFRTRDYYRVRVGIGRPPGRQDPAKFVLNDFAAAERKDLPLVIERAADAVEALLRLGLPAAQNEYHPAAPAPPADPARGLQRRLPLIPPIPPISSFVVSQSATRPAEV